MKVSPLDQSGSRESWRITNVGAAEGYQVLELQESDQILSRSLLYMRLSRKCLNVRNNLPPFG